MFVAPQAGTLAVVLDPASLLVNRKAKQRKTDRIDAKKMVRALLAHDRGDAAVLSRVRVPSVAEEDRKRLIRERRRLVMERTSFTNSIKGLLKLHGVEAGELWMSDVPGFVSSLIGRCGTQSSFQLSASVEYTPPVHRHGSCPGVLLRDQPR